LDIPYYVCCVILTIDDEVFHHKNLQSHGKPVIQGVSGGIVNMLGGGNMDYSE